MGGLMEHIEFKLNEIYELRRHLKAFLAQLDRALVEIHLTEAQRRDRTVAKSESAIVAK